VKIKVQVRGIYSGVPARPPGGLVRFPVGARAVRPPNARRTLSNRCSTLLQRPWRVFDALSQPSFHPHTAPHPPTNHPSRPCAPRTPPTDRLLIGADSCAYHPQGRDCATVAQTEPLVVIGVTSIGLFARPWRRASPSGCPASPGSTSFHGGCALFRRPAGSLL
jgi:hypothetical protein